MTRLGTAEGISGSGILADVEIAGKKLGESPLRFTHHSVRDPHAGESPSEFEDGKVTVID
jgi:hypothetical protein